MTDDASPAQATGSSWAVLKPFLEPVAAVLPLAAALLPVTGFVARWTALSLASFGDPAHLAGSLPLGELSGIGAGIVLLWLALLMFQLYRIIVLGPQWSKPPAPTSRRGAVVDLTARCLILVACAVLLLAFYPVSGIGTVVLAVVVIRRSESRMRASKAIPIAWVLTTTLWVSLAGATAAGIAGSQLGTYVGDYTFLDGAASDGVYLTVGDTDTQLLLIPCQRQGPVVLVVDHAHVKTWTIRGGGSGGSASRGTAIDLVRHGVASFGLDTTCP